LAAARPGRRPAVDIARAFADNGPSMLLGKTPTDPKRWPRGQKFSISASGTPAQESYRSAVAHARASGRTALDSALAAWAAPLGVAPSDGVLLAELSGKRLGVSALCAALDGAGIAAEDVRAGIARLVAAGLVEPVPLHEPSLS
jgi:hypothetical protein